MSSSESNRERRVEEIVEQFFAESAEGDDAARIAELLEAHPDLAPLLEQQLKVAASLASSPQPQLVGSVGQRAAADFFRLQCPHCGNHVRVVEDNEATCHTCGSSLFDEYDDPEATLRSSQGHSIGRFKIVSECGRGAFGTVYEAFDPELNRTVAVKVLRSGSVVKSRDKHRFMREAQSAAKLRHANIVQIYEIGLEDNKFFIVSDFIDGFTLDQLAKKQKLPYRRCAEIVEKICRALHYAHESGLIHRDVKPSNILLDDQNEPFLADFGLARDLEPDFTMTREGEIVGTPAYMSPEQAAAEHSCVNAQSDVYCAGGMLYRLLTGQLPFRGSNRMVLNQVMNELPQSPKVFDDQVPFDLSTIVLKAMEKKQKDRFSSAGEMADDIRRWLSGDPIRARRPSWTKVLWLRCKKYPLASSLIAGMVALMLALTIGSVLWAFSEAVHRTELSEKNQQIQKQQIATLVDQGLLTEKSEGALASLPYFEAASQVDIRLNGELSEQQRLRLAAIAAVAPALTAISHFGERIDQFVDAENGIYIAAGSQVYLVSKKNLEVIRKFNNEYRSLGIILSPDKSRLVSIGRSAGDPISAIKVWDTTNGRLVAELRHDSHISNVAISFDSKKVATADLNHTVKLWNAEDGSELDVLSFDEPIIPFLDFTADGQQLVVVTRGYDLSDSTVLLWDLEEKKKTRAIDLAGGIHSFCLKQDRVVVGTNVGAVHQWDYKDPDSVAKSIAQFDFGVKSITDFGESLTYQLDNKQIVYQKSSDSGAGTSVGTPHGLAQALSSNGSIAVSSHGSLVHSWWTQTGDTATIPLPHGQLVTATGLIAGRWLAVGGAEGLVKVWDLASTQRNEFRWDDPNGDRCVFADVSSLVNRVVVRYESGIWELQDLDGNLVKKLPALLSNADELEILPREKKILLRHQSGEVSFLDLDGKELLRKDFGEKKVKFDVCDQLRQIAIASTTAIELLDLNSLKSVASIEIASEPRCVRFSKNGGRLFLGAGKSIKVWDVQSRPPKMIHDWDEERAIRFIEPIKENRIALRTSGFTNVWEMPKSSEAGTKPERLHQFREYPLTSAAPIHVEKFDCLVTVDTNGFIAVREIADLEKVRCLIRLTSLTNYWIDDQLGIVVCGTQGGWVRTFDLKDGREVLPSLETYGAAKVKLTQDGQFILTQSNDQKTVLRRIYDPSFSFDEDSRASVFLTGKQFEAGRVNNASPELQSQRFSDRKMKSQQNERHLERWTTRVERLGLL